MYRLVIGNRNYSSWSLRAWLYLRESHLAFEEIRIPLFSDSDWRARIARYTPAGRVPVLLDGDFAVWDTLSIFEYVREREPRAVDWPDTPRARAVARSVCAEMHAGFAALREELPQNLRVRRPRALAALSPACRADVERVQAIWSDARASWGRGGPWLFGRFSIADVVFAPVALRFVTYAIPLAPEPARFVERVQGLESVGEWTRLAAEESESLPFIDELRAAPSAGPAPG